MFNAHVTETEKAMYSHGSYMLEYYLYGHVILPILCDDLEA